MTDWNGIPPDKLYPTLDQFLDLREKVAVLEEHLDEQSRRIQALVDRPVQVVVRKRTRRAWH